MRMIFYDQHRREIFLEYIKVKQVISYDIFSPDMLENMSFNDFLNLIRRSTMVQHGEFANWYKVQNEERRGEGT